MTEVIYLGDQESGDAWSATPAPIRDDTEYTVRHGAGFSSFAHRRDGLAVLVELPETGSDLANLRTQALRDGGAFFPEPFFEQQHHGRNKQQATCQAAT